MDLSLFSLHRQWASRAAFVVKTARPAVRRAPVGARVASQRCPILRWSKWFAWTLVQVLSKGVFPVSVSLGGYRRGKGNGW